MDNKISGKIVRADNNTGIENLNVAIFDIDSAILEAIRLQLNSGSPVLQLFGSQAESRFYGTIWCTLKGISQTLFAAENVAVQSAVIINVVRVPGDC